jgi:hypothetical protein
MMTFILTAAFYVGAVFMAYQVGKARGTCKGRALGWCDYHFDQIEKDKARRDRAGRFTTTKKKAE